MKEEVFVIEGFGAKRLAKGEIVVNGAKNDVLHAFSASILFGGGVKFSNVPNIEDKKKMLDILSDLGAEISDNGHEVFVDSSNINKSDIPETISKMMRASILLVGPILGKLGRVSFPHPGGCVLGERPIDFFLEGFSKMGVTVSAQNDSYILEAKDGLKGAEIFFRKPSVTATETFIMAGVLADGKTILKNCPTEPEISNLINFLNSSGAKIGGVGTATITIEGQKNPLLANTEYRVIPDRIEAGSFLILASLVGDNVTIKNCIPEHLDSLINFLEYSGVILEKGENFLKVLGVKEELKPLKITTHEYPGFPTDLQAPMAVLLTQIKGSSHIFETIFEGRLSYLDTLNIMGAKANILNPHEATLEGITPLKGREVKSPDLRAGLAYVLAGIVANGKTVVHNVHHIDRGYESIEKRLSSIGINIKREVI